MQRTWNERHHFDQRKINKRLDILNNAWYTGRYEGWKPPRNFLSKYNLVCSCRMCRAEKYSRPEFKRETQRLIQESQ